MCGRHGVAIGDNVPNKTGTAQSVPPDTTGCQETGVSSGDAA